MHEKFNAQPVQIRVNQRALVQKVLARYPEEFTVFRELVQNADDAGAGNVEIEFQTEEYSHQCGENPTNGHTLDSVDLNKEKIFKWIVKNDGAEFSDKDWDRLTNIADGNPDEQKIGAFGVGFYSVFSVTDCPVVISGGRMKKLYYEGDQMMVLSGDCAYSKGTVIEMKMIEEQLHMPKPFDLSRFLCTAVTFLTKVEKITVRFNGHILSEIQRIRHASEKLEVLPTELKRRSASGMMTVTSVEKIPQRIDVTLTKAAYAAGTRKSRINKASTEKYDADPVKRANFFGEKHLEPNGHAPISRSPSVSDTTTFHVDYDIYSASVSSTPTKDVACGLEAATKKNPPSSFLCEVVYLNRDQHQQAMQDGKEADIGSVFRGAQALCSEDDAHGSRLFIGQSTAQTSGIAIHLSSRFIPTVERGSIDLANGHVATWNQEVLYVGGYLTRLIYERAMSTIRGKWPESPGPLRERLQQDALHVMKCFTFQPSTPESKVGELLKNAFFECSTSDLFPILSNLGIRNTKDVRIPNTEFQAFMKNRPVLHGNPLSVTVKQLPECYVVGEYKFRDVLEELDGRVLSEEEMIACVRWWVRVFKKNTKDTEDIKNNKDSKGELRSYWKDKASPVAKFRSTLSPRIINLSEIKKFVDKQSRFSSLRIDNDPLPQDTIPTSFTAGLDANDVIEALGWERLTVVDWIRYLVSPGLDPSQDICKNEQFSDHVLKMLQTLWVPSIGDADKETIIRLMQMVPCITTNLGMKRPQDVYFPEGDLFNELPVVPAESLPREYLYPGNDIVVLEALGAHRFLRWDHVMDRLLSNAKCSTMRLTTYLDTIRRFMAPEEFMSVKQLAIFPCESEETRRCISELYVPDPKYRELGLPILGRGDVPTYISFQTLEELGLQQYPPLEVIIQKACSEDPTVRTTAWNFFVNNFDKYYDKYEPDDFRESHFLPCTSGRKQLFSTPEKVFISSEWEIFGFYTIRKSQVLPKVQMKLKVKDKPSARAIIEAIREAIRGQSLPDRLKAQKWFDLLARNGGFSFKEQQELSEIMIVPLPPNPLAPKGANQKAASPRFISPSKCFYGKPDPKKPHHSVIFVYVDFGQPFLRMCHAKEHPDCSDIVTAMIEDPQEYLNKIEALRQCGRITDPTHKIYLDDLRQVAAGYHSLPEGLRESMKTAPIFMSFRKKPRATDGSSSAEKEYALKPAREILIADDLESQRLFGEHIYVAPKEEVFENFYRDYGSESLSAHVKHEVTPKGCVGKKEDLRFHVFERLRIFLHDQDSTRRSDFKPSRWGIDGAFTVECCRELAISKSLEFEHVTPPDGKPLLPIPELASAGIFHTEEKDILWVTPETDGSQRDWYDVAVAICRIVFSVHKPHDTLLLMTILDSNIADLRRRGYDVDQINNAYEEETQRADQTQGPAHGSQSRTIPIGLGWFTWLKDLDPRKKRKVSEEYLCGNMESMVNEALKMCQSDADKKKSSNAESKPKGGKKRTDVRYCDSHQVELERMKMKKGMPVFKTRGSEDPPESELEAFSGILEDLGKVFNLGSEKLHIFWHQADTEMMGFNRNRAVYLNLAHFKEKHTDRDLDDTARAAMYTAWYFIIAHEIAHNKASFHDEDHELLFSSIAQHRLLAFKKLLEKRAPDAKC